MVRYIRYCPSETTATKVKKQVLREVQFFIQAVGNKQTAQSNMPLLTPSKYLLKTWTPSKTLSILQVSKVRTENLCGIETRLKANEA